MSAYVNDAFHIEWLRHVRRKLHTPAYVSVRQHTSGGCIRQHTSTAYVSIRQHTSTPAGGCRRRGSWRVAAAALSAYAYVSIRIRQHTSAYGSWRVASAALLSNFRRQYVYFCASKASKQSSKTCALKIWARSSSACTTNSFLRLIYY